MIELIYFLSNIIRIYGVYKFYHIFFGECKYGKVN